MKRAIALSFIALSLLAMQLFAEDPNTKQKQSSTEGSKLTGSYKIVAGERSGEKIAPERFNEVAVRIDAKVITTFDKDEKEVYAASYEIDSKQKPWRITLITTVTPAKADETSSQGLIEVDGDTVRLIYALPGGKAPTSFKTGDQHQMFVLKRQLQPIQKKASK